MNLVRWALWSRTNLIVLCASVLTIMVLLSVGMSLVAPARAPQPARASQPPRASQSPSSAPSARASASPTPSASASVTALGTDAQADPSPARDDTARAVEDRTRAFVSAWLHTGTGWLANIRPHVVPDLVPLLEQTDQANIPHAELAGVKVTGTGKYDATTEATLSNGMTMRVNLMWDGQMWKVRDFLPGGPA